MTNSVRFVIRASIDAKRDERVPKLATILGQFFKQRQQLAKERVLAVVFSICE